MVLRTPVQTLGDGLRRGERGRQRTGRLTAIKVEVEPNFDAERVRIRGRVEQVDAVARSLSIAGIPIPTDASTSCELDDRPPITCDAFFATVQIGDLVEARDNLGPFEVFDVADKLEIED